MSELEPSAPVIRLTPAGAAGVAVLQVSGPSAVARLRETFSGQLPGPGAIAYGTLEGRSGEIFDEVLVVRAVSVGDALAELVAFEVHMHGSPFLVAEVTRRLHPTGDPTLDPTDGHSHGALGRSEENGPMFRERASALVSTAPSVLGARILLDQGAGAMERALARLRMLPMPERSAALVALARRGRKREPLFRETVMALIGPVNAGKSTLFNVLVGADAAAVSSEEGTTRDALSERARLGPWPVRFLDTAGERDLISAAASGDERALVEQEGQRIGAELAGRADLVLRLVPASCGLPSSALLAREIVLVTQAARNHGADPARWPAGAISALEEPSHARGVVEDAFSRALGLAAREALWTQGEAVPFDRRSILALESAAGLLEVTDTVLDELARSL